MRALPPRFVRSVTRVATVVLALPALLVGLAAGANGNEVVIEHPVMYFGFAAGPTSTTVCGNGSLRAAPSPSPTWTLVVVGARAPGTPIVGNASSGGDSASVCIDVPKQGAPAGTYTVTFTFTSVPSSDKPAVIVAHVAWAHPVSDGEIIATEQ